MGVEMRGSSRSYAGLRTALKDKLMAYNIVYVPENNYCQKCRNLESRYQNLVGRKKKDEINPIPKEVTSADIYKYEIAQLHRKEFMEKRQAEQKAKTKEQIKQTEAKKEEKK